MEMLILLSICVFFVVITVLVIRWARKQNKKRIELYQKTADRLGLKYTFKKLPAGSLNRLEGELEGVPLSIYEEMVGVGKHRHMQTHVLVKKSPFNFEFSIGKEQFFSKTAKIIGFNDVEFGDAELDDIFLLKSKSEDEFRAMMDEQLQQKLKSISSALEGEIHASNGKLDYTRYGALNSKEDLEKAEQVLRFMLELSKV
ncbi:MAG: hypothetical protein WDZ35_13695 [Crocinitomicaceae bacterium]